ncbi:MAG: hypothetical protein A3E87_08390 [Gammaproteobacteria bacterium RIFCSPHIGHO2_12_FULL_35_23]|nr:MAG: hypothetical protein A3E87_08390 [Gammaproteobacteria bacterium RIFCSPHIGHO2_12_FULL_35_23]
MLNQKTIFHSPDAVHLWHQGDDIAILSFESKANCASPAVLEGIHQTIAEVEKNYQALVIWQPNDKFFCVGADLAAVSQWVKDTNITAISQYLTKFQQTSLLLRYCKIPVIAAVKGYALGGGCELIMHCDQVIVSQTSRIGLVEAAIGLVPSGSGTKEMIVRACKDSNHAVTLLQHFLQISQGLISKDAEQAKSFHYLRHSDLIIAEGVDILAQAKLLAKKLSTNYCPPQKLTIPKMEMTQKEIFIKAYQQKNPQASEYDNFICEQILTIFFPSTKDNKAFFSEEELLTYELNAFMNLVTTPKTIERIQYTLNTGKHLHN